jgi:hypothetical protein
VISWLGGNRKRVIGYGNAGDLNSLWPSRGDAKLILANYSANPDFPAKIGHQFADNYNVPPFGPCDINSADGLNPSQLAEALGLTEPSKPVPTPSKPKDVDMILIDVDPKTLPKGTDNPGIFLVGSDLQVKHVLAPGSTNVVAYQKAGIPGPVTITYAEFQTYKTS